MKTSNELGLNYLNRALPKDEVNEDESLYTEGDCVLYQFYCGNWSQTLDAVMTTAYIGKNSKPIIVKKQRN